VATEQDQQNETSAPDGGIEEPAAASAGHAFWRRAGRHASDQAEPGDAESDSVDAEAEPDDGIIVAEPVNAEAEPGDVAAESTGDQAEPDEDVIAAEPDDIVVAEPDDIVVAEPDDIVVAEPDDIVVAEVIDEEPGRASPSRETGEPGAGTGQPVADVTGPTPAGQAAGTRLSQQWHDIQATFVDDPRGAVQLAAEATDAALNGLIASLRSRQDALSAATGDSAGHRDTEQLRGELRQYRVLCQNLAKIEQRLAQPGTTTAGSVS
jgi:hypothetical protein